MTLEAIGILLTAAGSGVAFIFNAGRQAEKMNRLRNDAKAEHQRIEREAREEYARLREEIRSGQAGLLRDINGIGNGLRRYQCEAERRFHNLAGVAAFTAPESKRLHVAELLREEKTKC